MDALWIKRVYCDLYRPGLTFAELRDEVLGALNSEGDKAKNQARDKALEECLLKQVQIEIPETLIIEQARQKFAIMMTDVSAPLIDITLPATETCYHYLRCAVPARSVS